MSSPSHPIFTIGHSTHAIETFIAILRDYGIEVVVDVRAFPYSRHAPQFNRYTLERSLRRSNIRYLYLGDHLGINAPHELSSPNHIDIQYVERLITSEPFRVGIERLIKGATQYQIALLCAEEDPAVCHRALLVGRALDAEGLSVQHIRVRRNSEAGTHFVETHQELVRRIEPQLSLPFIDPLLDRAVKCIRERWKSLESHHDTQHESSPLSTGHERPD